MGAQREKQLAHLDNFEVSLCSWLFLRLAELFALLGPRDMCGGLAQGPNASDFLTSDCSDPNHTKL